MWRSALVAPTNAVVCSIDEGPLMHQYVIEREIPGAGKLTEAEIHDISVRSLDVLNGLGPQIQWMHSYVSDDRIYCVYLSADESLIRAHARQLGVPASRISAVRRLIDPAKYAHA
jgi:hypothetical protein